MTVALALLLAGLADGVDEAQRRARLQELRNRLGLLSEALGPFEARLRWSLAFLREPRHQWTFLHLLQAARHQPVLLVAGEEPVDILIAYDERFHRGLRLGPETRVVPTYKVFEGRSDLGPILPWLARELVRWFAPERGGVHLYPMLPYLEHMLHHDIELLDWVEAEHPDLGKFTAETAWAAVEAWHRQFVAVQTEGQVLPGVVVARTSDGGTIERLVTKGQLIAEGEAMGHCIGGSYDPKHGAYFSWRNADGAPQETAEVEQEDLFPEVIQHVGVGNDVPNDDGPLAAYMDRLCGRDVGEYVGDRLKAQVVRNLEELRERMAPFTASLVASTRLLQGLLPGDEPLWTLSDVRWDAHPEAARRLEEVLHGAFRWAKSFAHHFNETRDRRHSSSLTPQFNEARWPAIFLMIYEGETLHLHLARSLGSSVIGWLGSVQGVHEDPLDALVSAESVTTMEVYLAREAALEAAYTRYMAQVEPVRPLEDPNVRLLPWRAFVALALERGAWPQGQRVPRGAR